MTLTSDRIRGRLVEVEVGEVQGLGWTAVGVVKNGLAPEVGLRFQATAPTSEEAARRLQAEIEAYFA
ncbi:MAG TPA: hypothetical protein VLF19_07720 [Methylomirabilota bacterium]|nr:hypothetical protein [Methylomirabilota bacterium]